jgi:hypothetical protein
MLANAPMFENRPTAEASAELRDELLFQRGTQAYLWALPLINTLGMKLGSEKIFGAGYNVLPIWKHRLDAKTLVTTPNSDVIYAMSYVDLGKDGPLVFDAPPELQGILLDFWQRPIPGPTIDGHAYFGDVGLPGPDAGKGGKFLLLPPGYKGAAPDGYYVYRSGTNNVFVFLRAFYQDPKNLKPPVDLIEKARIYPFGDDASAKPMTFPNASGVPADMLPISDGSVFDALKQLVDAEGDNLAGPDGLAMLAAIGIVKGQPFSPDAHAQQILDRAAKTAYKMSRVIGFENELNGGSLRVYPDRQWVNPIDNITPKDARNTSDLTFTNIAGAYRARRADLVLYQLLFDQPRHGLEDSWQGRGLHDRLCRQRRKAVVRRIELQTEPSRQYPGRQLLVGDALRGRKRFRPRQRPALPLARLARQAGPERRR